MKPAKIFVPKKIKGGVTIGKEGEVWFAIKCANFNATELRVFKTYIGEACKEFFEPDTEDEKEE